MDTLADLADRMQTGRTPALTRVVIETTGLADPTPVLAALMSHPALVQAYALDGVVTVVDALSGLETLESHEEARRQAAVADRLVITKTDLAPAGAKAALSDVLVALNPRAPILDAGRGEALPAVLFGCGLFDPETKIADVAGWLGDGRRSLARMPTEPRHHEHEHEHEHEHHGHDAHGHHGHPAHEHHDHGQVGPVSSRHGGINSFSILHGAPIPVAVIYEFLDLLAGTQGPRLLRMKAVVATVEQPSRPLVLHGVRTYLHPPVRLPSWPGGMAPSSRLVLIGDDLDERHVRDLFAAFTGTPRLDAPDRAALTDNPLAVPGFAF